MCLISIMCLGSRRVESKVAQRLRISHDLLKGHCVPCRGFGVLSWRNEEPLEIVSVEPWGEELVFWEITLAAVWRALRCGKKWSGSELRLEGKKLNWWTRWWLDVEAKKRARKRWTHYRWVRWVGMWRCLWQVKNAVNEADWGDRSKMMSWFWICLAGSWICGSWAGSKQWTRTID